MNFPLYPTFCDFRSALSSDPHFTGASLAPAARRSHMIIQMGVHRVEKLCWSNFIYLTVEIGEDKHLKNKNKKTEHITAPRMA